MISNSHQPNDPQRSLGGFLSSRKSRTRSRPLNSSKSSRMNDASTIATASVTLATFATSTSSTVLFPMELPGKTTDPFDYFARQVAERAENQEAEAPPLVEKAVEGVWFGSISDRFQKFCLDRYVDNSSSSVGEISPQDEPQSVATSASSMQDEEDDSYKTVRFNMFIEYIEDYYEWTSEDLDRCSYDADELEMLRSNTAIAAHVLLANNSRRLACFAQAYKKCCKDVQKANREADRPWKRIDKYLGKLVTLYELDPNTICGLEHYILTTVRGDPKSLRNFVQQQTQSWVHRAQGGGKPKDDNDNEKIIAHISQCVSQPSQLLSHAMAVALAETMLSDALLSATLVEGMEKLF